jgi:hypothetical protein
MLVGGKQYFDLLFQIHFQVLHNQQGMCSLMLEESTSPWIGLVGLHLFDLID